MANPPPAGPATAVQDPYGPANDGVTFVNTSPNPATPTDGLSSVMKLYVPADNSFIELGATDPKGITAHAITHVLLQAETPLTTIELGTPNGGLKIGTAGHKDEHITQYNHEFYDDEKQETVGGNLLETFKGTKTETVTLKVTENYNNVKEENITGPLTQTVTNATTNHYQGTLTEDVGGAWKVDPVKGDIFFNTTGNFKVTAATAMKLTANGGNIEITASDQVKTTSLGDSKWFTAGKLNRIVVGLHSDTRLAIHIDTRLGSHIDTKVGINAEIRAALVRKIGTAFDSKAGLCKWLGALRMENWGPHMRKAGVFLGEAAMHVVK
jgi:hypothetical protein